MAVVDKIISALESAISTPIGLYNKSNRYAIENLDRNEGNQAYGEEDGFGTPIGSLSNPYKNNGSDSLSWFAKDVYKNQYANYLEYIAGQYKSTLRIDNTNTGVLQILDGSAEIPASIEGSVIENLLTKSVREDMIASNANSDSTDTKLGKDSSYFLNTILKDAINKNDERKDNGFGISSELKSYFGLGSEQYSNGILTKYTGVDETTGRYADVSPLGEDNSPLDASNWGEYKNLGSYQSYHDNLTDKQKSYHLENINLNKYKVNLVKDGSGESYLDSLGITSNKVTLNGSEAQYIFKTLHSSDTIYNIRGTLKSYGESEDGSAKSIGPKSFNAGDHFGSYQTFDTDPIGVNDLLNKTNENFMQAKYDTLISRFHTPNWENGGAEIDDATSTAVSYAYGMSRGRNLLKYNHKGQYENGYTDPYCRVWTYHHEYAKYINLIRPLTEDGKVLTPADMEGSKYNFSQFRSKAESDSNGSFGSGGHRLTQYGVIGYKSNAGAVNIAPKKKKNINIKSCMFSIENLAWKGMFGSNGLTGNKSGLSAEQKGPFGGRIMWFPPYDIKFNESVSTNWNGTDFIGRGESIWTYTNTARDGQLSFKLLIDHPSIVDYWHRRQETDTCTTVDDVESKEQELLRFFAGCSMLSANKVKKTKKKVVKPVVKSTPSYTEFKFFIFYPNDYSGQSDSAENAMKYIINGVGTQREYYYTGNTTTSTRGSSTKTEMAMDMLPWYNSNKERIGGYEMRSNGISVVTKRNGTNKDGVVGNDYQTTVYRNSSLGNQIQLGKQVSHYKGSGKRLEWYYRVDKKRETEKLVYDIDYLDTKSYKLNSGGYQSSIRSTFGISSKEKIFSFADVYVALSNNDCSSLLSGCYSQTNVNEIKKLIDEYGVKSVTVRGWASSHGITINTARNNVLNANRKKTAISWLVSTKKLKGCSIKGLTGKVGPGPKASNVSNLGAKIYRCAEVTVKINSEKNSETSKTLKEATNASSTVSTYLKSKTSNSKSSTTTGSTKTNSSSTSYTNKYGRYDEEAEFFDNLSINDPLLKDKISEKVKYFDPAFHSVSPEGFNARLTFLQQCSRQGPTIGGSDALGQTANNMSFGRPPVCVLRLGDFYYSKVIITNINYDYDPMVWDLNNEGIGAMPMICNVSLNFHFIGGSDLAGPINRLQNALSFNYYANTGVYDNRSEEVKYDDDGDLQNYKAFP